MYQRCLLCYEQGKVIPMCQNSRDVESTATPIDNIVPDSVLAFVRESPVSMWVMDPEGTLVSKNAASRELFALGCDDTLVGKYNIFRDEEMITHGYAPKIRRVFEEGASTQFVLDYKFSYVRHILSVYPMHIALRIFIFGARDGSEKVQYVIVQHDDYTEQWREESALAESEAHYRSLVEHISDWVWVVDLDGRLLYSNHVVENTLGHRIDEILGRRIFDFIVEQERECVREEFRQAIHARSRLNQLTLQVVYGDGSIHFLEARGEPTFDQHDNLIGYRGTARDFTERHAAEEAVRRSEQKFRTIFDHMPAAIFAYDRDGVILQANAACERVYGITPEHLVGRSVRGTVVSTEESERVQKIIARVFSGETVRDEEWQFGRPDGSSVYVSANTAPLYDDSGKAVLGIGLNIDITDRKLEEQRKLELEKNKREFYRSTIFAATDGKLVIADHEEIEEMVGPSLASWSIAGSEDVSTVRHGVEEVARSVGMEESKIDDLVLCVGELTTNAVKHAGGGDASVHQLPEALLFVCRDHGPGIEAKILPQATLKTGYSTAPSLGIGYKEVILLADRVSLATGPAGTTVAVEMKLQPQPLATELLAQFNVL